MSRSMRRSLRHALPLSLLACALALPAGAAFAAGPVATATATTSAPLAFPGAQGWAAHASGGRGGRIIKVTTLAAEGPGSISEALAATGPRIVVFEVGGIIDLGAKTLKVTAGDLTIAGQTAPNPGITFIRGGFDILANNVIVRHIRVRPGSTGAGHFAGVDFDGISTVNAHDIIVDHCSLTWATDENLSASGTRFAAGAKPGEYGQRTSHRVTFSNNIIAEGLAFASHAKGEHSKGSLIHDHVNDILIVGNLYAHNYERNPLFKGGVKGQVINNMIYDPGQRAVHYNLIAEEWLGHPYETGQMVLRGNVLRGGKSSEPMALFEIGGSGDLDLYMDDNIAVDRIGNPLPQLGRYTNAPVKLNLLRTAPALPFGVKLLSATQVQDAVVASAGARPWDRDDVDRRILADTIEGRGEIIDNESEVGGYPKQQETRQPFVAADWDLATMEPQKPLQHRDPLH